MPANVVTITPEVIAGWPPANYKDPYERIWAIPLLATIYSVSSIMYLIRTWTRLGWPNFRNGTLGWDDLLLFCGWGLTNVFLVIGAVGELRFYALRHFWDVPRDAWPPLMILFFVGEIVFVAASGVIRISILLFYRRLTEIAVARTWKWLTWIAIAMVVVYSIAWIVFILVDCTPIYAFWQVFDLEWKGQWRCIDFANNNVIAGSLGAFTDLYTVILPVMMTRKLPLSRGRKVALRVIFLLGLLTVAVSCIRTYYTWRMTFDTDLSWQIHNTYAAALVELCLGIACASAPACWVSFRTYILRPLQKLRIQSPFYFTRGRMSTFDGTLGSTVVGTSDVSELRDSVGGGIVWNDKSAISSHTCRNSSGSPPPKLNLRYPPPSIGESNDREHLFGRLSPIHSVDEFVMQDWDIIEASRRKLRQADERALSPQPCIECGIHTKE